MDLYDIAVARKLSSGGGGGGGSSDFSTAKVTVNINSPSVSFEEIYIEDYRAGDYQAGMIPIHESIAEVLMVKNQKTAFGGIVTAYNYDTYYLDTNSPISTTGGITWDDSEEEFIVTGDGSISVSLKRDLS